MKEDRIYEERHSCSCRKGAVKIPCWIETHRRIKWRLAMRTASVPDERWAKKAAQWNPGLSIKHKTCRSVGGRPKKGWEDEMNDFLKPEETEATSGNERKNDTWITAATNRERWKEMESEYAIAGTCTRGAYPACGAGRSTRTGLTLIGNAHQRSTRSPPCLRSKACTKAFLVSQRRKSQRADERKPLGHKSLPHFTETSLSCSQPNPRIPQFC